MSLSKGASGRDGQEAQVPTAKLLRQTMTDLVAEALRQRILSGALEPGDALRQEAIADELGVSRIPVREAIQRLKAEGMIDIRAHRGAFVRGLSVAEVIEAFELRMRLEPWLGREAARHIEADALKRARALVRRMDDAGSAEWGILNWTLHETLYRPARREMTLDLLKQLHRKAERYFHFQVFNAPIRAQAHAEHIELIERCKERDLDGVERALVQHIDTASCQIVSIVKRIMQR